MSEHSDWSRWKLINQSLRSNPRKIAELKESTRELCTMNFTHGQEKMRALPKRGPAVMARAGHDPRNSVMDLHPRGDREPTVMAMTRNKTKMLPDAVEPRTSTNWDLGAVRKTTDNAIARSSWLGGLTDRLVMKFVCCAPPHALLDDDEIHEILALMEEHAKPEHVTMPLRTSAHPDSLVGSPFGDIARPLDSSALINEDTSMSEAPQTSSDGTAPHLHVSLGTMQRVVLTLLSIYKTVEIRQTERAVRAVQMTWRRRNQTVPTASTVLLDVTSLAPVSDPTTTAESDHEPKVLDALATQMCRSNRSFCSNKKTKSALTRDTVEQKTGQDIESPAQPALTRKRSVRLVDPSPRGPSERGVRDVPGEDELLEEDDEEILELGANFPLSESTLQRYMLAPPPPPTAFRPRAVKPTSFLELRAASNIQRAWSKMKARHEREIQSRLEQYELEKHSVMPTIRSEMFALRKRLELLQERNCGSAVVAAAEFVAIDDDFDWL